MSTLLSFAQNLVELLYKAAEETGKVNPTKVKEILGVSLTDGETTDAVKKGVKFAHDNIFITHAFFTNQRQY